MFGLTGVEGQIVLALIALVSLSITTLVWVIHNGRNAKVAADEASAANSAVNNVGPGKHNLYDMVERISNDVESLKRDQDTYDAHGWETLPADISTAVGLTVTIRELQDGHKRFEEKIDKVLRLLAREQSK